MQETIVAKIVCYDGRINKCVAKTRNGKRFLVDPFLKGVMQQDKWPDIIGSLYEMRGVWIQDYFVPTIMKRKKKG